MNAAPALDLTVIAPAHNERENLRPLVEELRTVLDARGRRYEIILVDDCSTDGSDEVLRSLIDAHPPLRALRLLDPPRKGGHGQSAAFAAGFRSARGRFIATLDADCQNDPADIPPMLDLLVEENLDFVQGDRTGSRKDSLVRRATSIVSKWLRRVLLSDSIHDSGCSLRVMRREIALQFPMQFRGMHRYMPILACDMGLNVREVPVSHRPRIAGVAKYGIVNRAIPGLFDVYAVRWMRSRRRPLACIEIEAIDEKPDTPTVTTVAQPTEEFSKS